MMQKTLSAGLLADALLARADVCEQLQLSSSAAADREEAKALTQGLAAMQQSQRTRACHASMLYIDPAHCQ